MGPTPRGWLLQALYTSAELCLIGDTSSLGALGRTLQESLETPIVVDLVEREPAPYDGCLLSLVVEVGDGAVVIGRKETTLTIHGGREQIAMLGAISRCWPRTKTRPILSLISTWSICPTTPTGITSGRSRCRWS